MIRNMVVHMEMKHVNLVKDMKFKVINERTKEVVGSGLAICAAREVARKHNINEKVDYFYIQEEKKLDLDSLEYLIKKYPNDADLGGAIRKLFKCW